MWDCVDKEGCVYFSEELKKAVACGNVVLKIHKALRFERSAYLRQFIDVFRIQKEQQDQWKDAKDKRYNPAMRDALKSIINNLYGKTLQKIREAESVLVDLPRMWELVLGKNHKRLLYQPRVIRDAGQDSCFTLTFSKPWAAATALPPCIGAAVLGNSKVRWYTMLEAGVSLGMLPVTGDTDNLMFAAPKGVTLEQWRPDHPNALPVVPALREELRDGIVHSSQFGKASDELNKHRLMAIAAPLAKFYSLLLAERDGERDGTLLTERYFPQSLDQLLHALGDLDGRIAEQMRHVAGGMTNAQMDDLRAYDLDALTRHWATQLGAEPSAVEPVVRRLERELPYVYTKLKSIRLQGNESLLSYLTCVRALVLEQRAHAEGDAAGDKPTSSCGARSCSSARSG